jgi:cytochrome P450
MLIKTQHKDPIHVGSVEAVQGVTTLTMADDDNHARQRRALSHSFSQKALQEQEYIVKRYVDQLISNMHRMAAADEEFNLVCRRSRFVEKSSGTC